MPGSPRRRARKLAGEAKPKSSRAGASRSRGLTLDDAPEYPPRNEGETQRAYLDRLGIDIICGMIRSGMMGREISRTLHITSQSLLSTWIHESPERVQAEAAALSDAARAWDEMALDEVRGIEDDAQSGAVTRAREAAIHLRWRASRLGRAQYGERVQAEISGPAGGSIQIETTSRPQMTRDEWLRAHGITADSGLRDGSSGDTPAGDEPAPAVSIHPMLPNGVKHK